MRKCLVILTALLCVIPFAGCKEKPRILLESADLKIVQTGGKIDVYDVESNMTYTFHIRHKNASKRLTELYTVADTPTLRIEKQYKKIILYVKRSEEIYTLSISRIFPNISLKLGVNE